MLPRSILSMGKILYLKDVTSETVQMGFYDYFYCIIIIFLALHFKNTASLSNKDIDILKTGVEAVNPCSVGMVLYAVVNNTSSEKDYNVEVTPDQCCLNTDSKDVCNVMHIEGDCIDVLNEGTSKVLKFVAPMIEPFERRGYCIVYLDSKPIARQRKSMRDKIKISFDTRLKNLRQPRELMDNTTICSEVDQDPLNDCKPVDCETFYNGKRSFFDSKTKRCIATPLCISDSDSEVPNAIYDRNKNKCIFGESVSKEDLSLIKKLTNNAKNRYTKNIIILRNRIVPKPLLYRNLSDVINKMNIKEPNIDYKFMLDKEEKIKSIGEKGYKFFVRKYIIDNKLALPVLVGVVVVQCFFIITLIYCSRKKCGGWTKKKVVKSFFNYRQDASVTTPLIDTSNMDTDTTEFQYYDETNNIDKMIKCYKACQKERNTQAKISMSDDILSKCLTRRDWKSKPARSVAIAECNPTEKDENEFKTEHSPINNKQNKRESGAKVNFENEQDPKFKQKKERKHDKYGKTGKVERSKREKHCDDIQNDLSERELKCHSYNYVTKESNLTGFNHDSHSKTLGYFDKIKKKVHPISLSTEKGAQVAFSNDSLDDFLSERGVVFKAGEDLSKYSFSSISNDLKSSLCSEISSKTSKNNVVKNVLSLFHRKVSHGPSSHPGAKKKDSNTNLELIHMSKASVYSSYNGSEYLKNLKQTKDSRTSL